MAGGSLYSRPYTKNLYPSWRSWRLGDLPFLGRRYLEAVSRTHCTRGVALSPSLGALPRPLSVWKMLQWGRFPAGVGKPSAGVATPAEADRDGLSALTPRRRRERLREHWRPGLFM